MSKLSGRDATFMIDQPFSQYMSPRTKEQFEVIREAAKDKILQASLELFGTKGFLSTSIADIVEKAGVSKGLMYHYYSSKEDLLRALLDLLNEEEASTMKDVFTDDPATTMENMIRVFFQTMRDNFEQWSFIASLSMQVEKFDFVRDLTKEKYGHYMTLVENLLTQLGFENPSVEAKLLGAIFDGIGYQYLVLKEEYPLDEFEKYLITKYCGK